ncbi:hypothetical protein [Flavobacterium sp. CLA17]|uniref:hypothetical protein n=1 Tax=Flavobacterium sp. CLA17 TaxID=2724135 RepID=UPI0014909206|nr:hypothetical protein [Flavobacterium sp. CLA17]QSB28513.1 hypothetical protein HAV12_007195 [Flavobacterium sp. CLA17]
MGDNYTQIIAGIIIILTTLAGGALYSKRKSKTKKTSNTQNNISITGNENKVIGGDDKSTN